MNATTVPSTAGITVEIVEVTPELAQKWLGLNTANRRLKPRQIAAFAADMKSNRWRLNGEAIKLAGPAYAPTKLLDGQNRLHALLKSQTTVTMMVVFGLTADTQSTMDSGAKRTVADNLKIAGVSNGPIVAAAAGIALRIAAGKTLGGGIDVTNATAEEFIYEHPDLIKSAEVANQFAHKADVPPSQVAYTHWVLAKIDPEQAYLFWRDASEKIGLAAGDPVIALTNRFAEARRNRERVPLPVVLSAVYRAWNYRRDGKTLRTIRTNSSNGGLVEIPEPK